jgi:hypothetical protein
MENCHLRTLSHYKNLFLHGQTSSKLWCFQSLDLYWTVLCGLPVCMLPGRKQLAKKSSSFLYQ